MLGENLKSLRNKRNLTQEELGEALGLSSSAIGMYEQNRRVPDIYTLKQMADFFNVSIDKLLESSQHSSKSNRIKNIKNPDRFSKNQYEKIISNIKAFFMNSNINEKDKEKLFRDITNLYWKSKEIQ